MKKLLSRAVVLSILFLAIGAFLYSNGVVYAQTATVPIGCAGGSWSPNPGPVHASGGTTFTLTSSYYEGTTQIDNPPENCTTGPNNGDQCSVTVTNGKIVPGYSFTETGDWVEPTCAQGQLKSYLSPPNQITPSYTVTATANAGGSIVSGPTPSSVAKDGTSQITVGPNSGFSINPTPRFIPAGCATYAGSFPGEANLSDTQVFTTGSIQANCGYTFSFNQGCTINSFTASPNPAVGAENSTLNFSLSGSFPWTISDVTPFRTHYDPSPSSGTGVSGTSTTTDGANLYDTAQTLRLTCGNFSPAITRDLILNHGYVYCSSSPGGTINIDQNVTWTAYTNLTPVTYTWTGTDGLSGTTYQVNKAYTSSGTKTGTVAVDYGSRRFTVACSPNVTVQDSAKPDLTTYNLINPTATVGVPVRLFANIKNQGLVATASGFSYIYQIASAALGGGNIDTRPPKTLLSPLSAGVTTSTQEDYTFQAPGTYSARACADKNSATDTGTIVESNEQNNCGDPWVNIVVSCPTGTTWNGSACQLSNPPVNGICSSSHYYCNQGNSINNNETSSQWTWTCASPNGGANDSCSETKYIDLTAATPPSSQNSATVDVPRTFTSMITNLGNIPTGASFPVIFQTSPVSNFSSGVDTYRISPDMSALGAGSNATATSPNITFSAAGMMYVQACADKSSAAGGGVISETSPGSEGNNCSGPLQVTITGSTAPDLTISVLPTPTTAEVNVLQSYSSTIRNIGTASTGAEFRYFFQVASGPGGVPNGSLSINTATSNVFAGDGLVDLESTNTAALAVGASVLASSRPEFAFTSPGIYSIRACADKDNSSSAGTIPESNEDNNCGTGTSNGWVDITVEGAPPATGIDLTAGNVSPATGATIVNEAQTFSSTIINQGDTAASGSINHIFQYDENADGDSDPDTGVIANVMVTTTSSIAGGGQLSISDNRTFGSAGQIFVRACADADARGPSETGATGTVTESVENNNCSPTWTPVTVSLPCPPGGCGGGDPVNGDWSGWSHENGYGDGQEPPGTCSALCAGGVQGRTCTAPAPQNGGLSCLMLDGVTRSLEEYRACNIQDCSGGGGGDPIITTGKCFPKHGLVGLCEQGKAINFDNDTKSWTWICTGGGGGEDADCKEFKKGPKFKEN